MLGLFDDINGADALFLHLLEQINQLRISAFSLESSSLGILHNHILQFLCLLRFDCAQVSNYHMIRITMCLRLTYASSVSNCVIAEALCSLSILNTSL